MQTRIALIGCGDWGVGILKALVGQLDCEVVVVVRSDKSIERAKAAGATRVVSSVDEIGDVQGVIITTPSSTHASIVESIASLGVPIFTEKPMTTSAESAANLVKLVRDRLFVMDKWRYHPGIAAMRDIRKSGELGKAIGLRLTRVGSWVGHTDADAAWDLISHDLSMALEIFGEVPQPVAAVGDLIDGQIGHLIGTLRTSAGEWVVTETSSRAKTSSRQIEMHFEHGVVFINNGSSAEIEIALGGASLGESPILGKRATPGEDSVVAELRAFVHNIHGGPAPKSSASEGAAMVEAITALRSMVSTHQ